MKFIVCEDYDEMSQKAAEIVIAQILLKPDCVLGLATGSTPLGMYEKLAHWNGDLSHVTTFNLDEYYPINRKANHSYYNYMTEHLYSKVNLKDENIFIPNGETKDPDEECIKYENLIKSRGGIDLQILGIGRNGHIGFNEPNTSLKAHTHTTQLSDDTIKANSRFFDSMDDVPQQALTMGIATIMNAKKILLLASGSEKKEVLKSLINNEINTLIPATLLAIHRDVTLIADKAAMGMK